jgi:hypothetical protein
MGAVMSVPHSSHRRDPAAARRRVSPRRYLVRRLGALAVLFALVGGLVVAGSWVLDAIGGDDGTVSSAADPAETAGTDGDGGDEPSDGVALAAETTTPPEGTSEGDATASTDEAGGDDPAPADPTGLADHVPTPGDPARVLIVGDSDAGTFGPYLEQLLAETGVVATTLDYKVSSGLARPDFFDWPAELDRILPEVDPHIVVVTFGGNDAQGLATADGNFIVGEPRPDSDNAEWRAEYGARAGAVMDQLLEGGRTVVWVGIPNDDNPDVTFRMGVQDQTVKAAAAERPELFFVDTWTRFAGRNGGWAEYVVDPRDGVGKDVRAADGFHLNETGAEILALDIAQVVRDDLVRRGASI